MQALSSPALLPDPKAAAIYVRISRDQAHDELGVRRQEKECRDLCRRHGLRVVDVFPDDDRSAFSGKPRPQYLTMLERLELGDFGVVVAWHPDRLHRSPRELEDFVDLLERTGTTVLTVQGGEYDLGTASGRMTARVVGAVARHESEHKSERLRAKMRQLVEDGKMTGGTGHRPFGYVIDHDDRGRILGYRMESEEAAVIRELADRLLAGESLLGLVRDLRERQIPTTGGGTWRRNTLHQILYSRRIAGLREHGGEVVEAPWPAIIEPEQHYRLRDLLDAQRAAHPRRRAARRYLLTGIVRCGRCEVPMVGHNWTDGKGNQAVIYVCVSERGGCGRVSVRGLPTDELVTDIVLEAVDHPDFAARMRRAEHVEKPPSERQQVEAKLASLGEMWADGRLSEPEWMAAGARLRKRLASLPHDDDAEQERQQKSARHALLARWQTRSLRDDWAGLTLAQRRAVVSALLEYVLVKPRRAGAPARFDASRIAFPDQAWRI